MQTDTADPMSLLTSSRETKNQAKKFKILLTQPLFDSSHLLGKFKAGKNVNTFPFGLACLAAVAREAGHEVKVLDTYHEGITKEEYLDYLKEEQFDVVGCTMYTLTFTRVKELFEITRSVLPNAVLMTGGAHPTAVPEETLKQIESLDIVVYGEGELTFLELLECMQRGKDFNSVKGIVYRDSLDGQIRKTPPRDVVKNLDDLPFPAYDLFPMTEYLPTPNLVRCYPTIATQITRGCPFQCSFCQYNLALGKKYRHRSVERVVDELRELKARYKIRGIIFRDSTLTVNPKFLMELCEGLILSRLDLKWMCYSRTDIMQKYHKELLPLMKKAGCWQIGYGCESGNQKSLDLLKKATTVESNIVAVKETIKAGIMCSTTWILGIPGETEEDAWKTVLLANQLASHVAKFFLPMPFPGSELEKICCADGGMHGNSNYDDYDLMMPDSLPYVNPLIGAENMIKMQRKAYVKYYTNPKVLYRNLISITDWDMIKKYWYFAKIAAKTVFGK